MNDYISREDYCEENCGKENREGYKTCKNCGMLNIPTADVQPIKHGRWIYVGSVRSWDEIKCSACNSAFSTEDRDLILNWDFCPHCGARMDLKDGDTNG